MFRTLVLNSAFGLYLVYSLVYIPVVLYFYILNKQHELDRFMGSMAKTWARLLLWAAGVKVELTGIEHIPQDNTICFISNHQGEFDIPIIMAHVGKPVAFIAKKELAWIPIMGFWMKVIRCIFIDRSNNRKSVKTIQKGVEQIKKGHPMLIFPEGTRSRGGPMKPFKAGSLKLAIRSNAIIVPMSIDGSYTLRKKGIVTPGTVRLAIHPTIDVKELTAEEKKELASRLYTLINSGLKNPSIA